jgi:dipeptidyl aminopeptidase/acylaminoacyl peptidase
MMSRSFGLCVCIALALAAGGLSRPADRKPLTAADYGKWENLGAGVLSPDGRWLAVPITRVDGTAELRLYLLADSGPAPARPAFTAAQGHDPAFSKDSRWLAYRIGFTEAEREKLEEDKKPVREKAALVGLGGDPAKMKAETFADVSRFAFAEGGGYLALLRYPPEGSKRKGADLVVRDLAGATGASFGNIAEFAWQERGVLLAMTVDAEGRVGNGVSVYDPRSGRLSVLDSAEADFTGLAWRKKDDDLAVLRSKKDEAHEDPTHVALAWRDLAAMVEQGRRAAAQVYDPAADSAFPSGTRIVSFRRPSWSDDGRVVFFGIQDWEPKPDGAKEVDKKEPEGGREARKPKVATVEVWHSRDERIIPAQRVAKERDRERNCVAAWHVDKGRFVRLGTDVEETVTILKGGRFALETDRKPYRVDNLFDQPRRDIYLLDVESGARRKVIDGVWHFQGGSATGAHLLYFKDDQYWTYDIANDRHRAITTSLRASWTNSEYDMPVRKQKPPWGTAGWTERDAAVLLYDRYDVWRVPPEGSGGTRLTRGAEEEIRHRYVRLDPEEEFIDAAKPLYVSLQGEWSKRSGYARLSLAGAGTQPQVDRQVWLDKNAGRLIKAKDAETLAWVVQDFDDSPDYFVSGTRMSESRQVTETNAFARDYLWGRSALVDYRSAKGERLQGALYYPAGWEAGRRYPMIVYVYERLSQGVHNYVVPSERSPYNTSVFTHQGYFVLHPDIVFRARDPGASAVDCVVPAVEKVLQSGMIDPKRVGLVGHSWGGYEASFIPTQTKIFAAAVAGAPLTNFFSFFGAVHWSMGMPETQHFETGQARMDVPYWVDHEAYVRNSPVMFIQQLATPMLVFFGDKDGTVDWHQGVELYNYARRAGKNLVMLVYAGEDHGARQKPNQIDYHRRVLQWFGHYLKGEPAPAWIDRGVTVLEREKELKKESK